MIRICKITTRTMGLLFPMFLSTVVCLALVSQVARRGPSPGRLVGAEPCQ